MSDHLNNGILDEEAYDEPVYNTSYSGNPHLKPVGFQMSFTAEQVKEIQKCQKDPHYFINKYCYIISLDQGLVLFETYEYQVRAIDHILGHRKGILMMPRQQGKTITAAACILHYTLFQDAKTVAIMANKGETAREILSRYQLMYENLPLWLQQGVKIWNKGNIELENGSKVFTGATTASGIRGKSVNWLYIDEAAIIPNNIAEAFFASTFPVISSGKTTKILITSTPLGYNQFWKYWNEAQLGRNDFVPLQIHYYEHPGRDEAWAKEQLRALGEVKYNQEVLCQFLGSSNTLISGRALGQMSSIDPIWQDEPGYLQVYNQPDAGHIYVIVVDTSQGVGQDYSAAVVIDVTQSPYVFCAKYRNNSIAPMLFPNVLHKLALDYNNAYVLIESDGAGGQVADILAEELEYEHVLGTTTDVNKTYVSPGFAKTTRRGVKMSKTIKRVGCFGIKSLVEEGKLNIFDADVISEFSTFVEKNGSYKADDGYHDDLVMSLVIFGWLTTNQYFKELTDVDIREKMYETQMAQIENELTPFGVIDDGLDEEYFVEDNVMWSSSGHIPWSHLRD